MKHCLNLYHCIRRFFKPHMYWTKEDIDQIQAKAQEMKWFFNQEDSNETNRENSNNKN